METSKLKMPPYIAYENHPGFKEVVQFKSNADNDAELKKTVDEIDAEIEKIKSNYVNTQQSFLNLINNNLVPKIQKLKTYTANKIGDEKVVEWLNKSFDASTKVLTEELSYLNQTHTYKTKLPQKLQKHLSEMDEKGYSLFNFSDETKKLLLKGAEPYFAKLKQMAKEKPGERVSISVPLYGKYGKAIKKIVFGAGIMSVAESFRKHDMELNYAALDYGYAGQDWFKNCYSDVGLSTSKTVTMHYDYETTMLKALIYLVPVKDIKMGAFRIVTSSHRWERSPFLFTFYKDLDEQYREVFGAKDKPSDNYYRLRFKTLEDRKRQMMLPALFRNTSHFGDDLIDGSELSETLLKHEFALLGNEPVCILFDGPNALHRGGFAYEGERWAIQIGLRLKENMNPFKRAYLKTRRFAGRIRRFQNPF